MLCERQPFAHIIFVRGSPSDEAIISVKHMTLTPGFGPSYRCFLTLDGGAVEAQGRHVVGFPLDVEDTLVVPLSRLRLRKILGG